MCCIGMPGHVPHTEWLSVLFIQGTSHKLRTAGEHAQPCIRVRIHHDKKCNATANSQGCLKMIMLFYPERIHNNSLRPFSLCPSQANEYISHTRVLIRRLQMGWTSFTRRDALILQHGQNNPLKYNQFHWRFSIKSPFWNKAVKLKTLVCKNIFKQGRFETVIFISLIILSNSTWHKVANQLSRSKTGAFYFFFFCFTFEQEWKRTRSPTH